ncbi:hypothetical protein QU593_10245 [Rossellomorea marisflavi]|uniref:hypothetical protein n=1 Tax=Rossellomorea marisflavi TaxID=189381 RepID=UPI0025B10FA9|nr:hypothetical protein [Rossellomorea marisflavi]WJV20785.1 hypothetical protein QU593_10245 [Rossellomorea marisflavi]
MKHKLLKFKKGLYEFYKEEVSGNKNISLDLARKKMTRNMLLSEKANSENHRGQKYKYGSLHFIVNQGGVITWMNNSCFPPRKWSIDKDKYKQLNKELLIKG